MNSIEGVVLNIERVAELSKVDVECRGSVVTAYMVGEGHDTPRLEVGSEVLVLFKESEVALAKNFSGEISLRNRFRGKIEKIERGRLLAEVALKFEDVEIVSVISRGACEAMKLEVGEYVTALVKANEITLMEAR